MQEGALWAYHSAAVSDAPDEFLPEPNFLYRYFNAEGYLLYLGITRCLPERDWAHWGKVWRPLAEYMFVETFPTRRLVESAEYYAYDSEGPHFNARVNYRPSFEARPLAWYGKRTDGKWVGGNPQWFGYDVDKLAPADAPFAWSHGRPQIPEGAFVDPRRAMVMG